jgi:hypothetical protein
VRAGRGMRFKVLTVLNAEKNPKTRRSLLLSNPINLQLSANHFASSRNWCSKCRPFCQVVVRSQRDVTDVPAFIRPRTIGSSDISTLGIVIRSKQIEYVSSSFALILLRP